MLPLGKYNSECKSNRIPQPEYTYLPGSAFLTNLTPPNKQPFKVKSKFESRDHVSNSNTIKFILLEGV